MPNDKKITDAEYRELIAPGVRRASATIGCDRLGLGVGCDGKTLRHARDEKSTLVGATSWNLLTVDPTALNEIAAHFGYQLVPLNATASTRLLADSASLTATIAEALADGIIDHREEQAIADKARPVVAELNGLIASADRKRA